MIKPTAVAIALDGDPNTKCFEFTFKEADVPDSIDEALELVFAICNGEADPKFDSIVEDYYRACRRSLSVGDIVCFKIQECTEFDAYLKFQCKPHGWAMLI